MAVERIGRHELRALRGSTAGAAGKQKSNSQQKRSHKNLHSGFTG